LVLKTRNQRLATRNLEPFSGAGNGLYASLGLKEFRLCGLENLKPENRDLRLGTWNLKPFRVDNAVLEEFSNDVWVFDGVYIETICCSI